MHNNGKLNEWKTLCSFLKNLEKDENKKCIVAAIKRDVDILWEPYEKEKIKNKMIEFATKRFSNYCVYFKEEVLRSISNFYSYRVRDESPYIPEVEFNNYINSSICWCGKCDEYFFKCAKEDFQHCLDECFYFNPVCCFSTTCKDWFINIDTIQKLIKTKTNIKTALSNNILKMIAGYMYIDFEYIYHVFIANNGSISLESMTKIILDKINTEKNENICKNTYENRKCWCGWCNQTIQQCKDALSDVPCTKIKKLMQQLDKDNAKKVYKKYFWSYVRNYDMFNKLIDIKECWCGGGCCL